MSQALDRAISRSSGFVQTTTTAIATVRAAGGGIVSSPAGGLFGDSASQAKNRQRYNLFRGWVYSAIDARASEAAGQPVHVARLTGAEPNPDERSAPGSVKAHQRAKMTTAPRQKAAEHELEIITDDPLVDALERPNPIQNRWQFVYSFFANLDLTGESYIVADADEDGRPVFYSLPTTWVRPDHTDGPFTKFRIVDPKNPAAGADAELLDRTQVARAYFPNPSDPMGAYAPAFAQMMAIRIDDHIQTSQETFFHQGIFPSYIITVGKNPGPTGDGDGVRPRLTGAQREQVHSAISKVSGAVHNYGTPAIVDGLIENWERMSMESNEMGWDKSEDKIKIRILSCFRVHPYILGEHVSVGGHAQVAAIERRFCTGVNTGLDMLSTVMTQFLGPRVNNDERTVIWWEACEAIDRKLRQDLWIAARRNDDVSQNEFRTEMGLPPDEDKNQNVIGRNAAQIVQILAQVGLGGTTPDQATAFFVAMGMPDDTARAIAGQGRAAETVQDATDALEAATRALNVRPAAIAKRITEMVR